MFFSHCDGYYKSDRMSLHLKFCKERKWKEGETSDCVHFQKENVKQQTIPLGLKTQIKGATEHLKRSVLPWMKNDEIKLTAINDELIMKFGSDFLRSRPNEIHRNYVSSKIRDLSTFLLEMKKLDKTVTCLEDCMNPKRIDGLITAVMNMSGYDPITGLVKTPSIAYRLSNSLKSTALLAKGDALQAAYQSNDLDLTKVDMFGHFVTEISSRWSRSIGKISTNMMKGAAADKVKSFALEEDIVKVCSYIEGSYRKLKIRLENGPDEQTTYDHLMTNLISHIMCLIRRRPVDFKRATLLHYSLLDQQDDLIDMVKNSNTSEENPNNIGSEELEKCRQFHIFYVPGKKMEIVPIVLTPLMKEVLDILIQKRRSVNIALEDQRLFLMSTGKIAEPNVCLRKMKSKVSLKSPKTFTNNGLRHQAATFSKLHSSHPQYQDFLASVLGHTLNIHKKHYELPTSVLQKMVVCPILYGMTKPQTSIENPETKTSATNKQTTGTNRIEKKQRSKSKYCITEHYCTFCYSNVRPFHLKKVKYFTFV